ncbi:MAG: orotate phosphoribosyltransferase [Candidatus Micrarchaeia archaeon]
MKNEQEMKEKFLDMLLKKGALRIAKSTGELFKFKSGRLSPNFINMGALTDGESLALLKRAYAFRIKSLLENGGLETFDFVFGPAYKGIPLACLTCEGLYELGFEVRYMYDRKEEKAYGDVSYDKVIVGAGYYKKGQRILVVDDVITTGATKIDSLEKLKLLEDARIAGMLVAVDRQELLGDAENVGKTSASDEIRRLGIPFFSIVNMQDIFAHVEKSLPPDIRKCWVDYYERYGAVKLV